MTYRGASGRVRLAILWHPIAHHISMHMHTFNSKHMRTRTQKRTFVVQSDIVLNEDPMCVVYGNASQTTPIDRAAPDQRLARLQHVAVVVMHGIRP